VRPYKGNGIGTLLRASVWMTKNRHAIACPTTATELANDAGYNTGAAVHLPA